MKNYFISFEDGDSALVYLKSERIGEEELKKFAEKAAGVNVSDICLLSDNEIQYYCIGGRVWIDTDEKVQRVLDCIDS